MGQTIFSGHEATASEENKKYAQNAVNDAIKNLKASSIIPVHLIEEDTVKLSNGKTITIHPKKIAQNVQAAVSLMRTTASYSFLKPYLLKPILWSYECKTACTDGIRIMMNPLFGNTLLRLGSKVADAYKNSGNQNISIEAINWKIAKYVVYIITHECYHVLYQHIKRIRLLLGQDNNYFTMANIAADLEINRDIESCFPELRGATQELEGVWWQEDDFDDYDISNDGKLFKSQTFEDILTWMMEHNEPKSAEDSPFNKPPELEGDNKAGSAYGNGWDIAVRGIQNRIINPEDMQFV